MTKNNLHQLGETTADLANLPEIVIGTVEELSEFRIAANRGDAFAQFQLGYLHFSNRGRHLGVKKNFKRSIRWFGASARQGHAEAQFHLGVMYQFGLGARRNRSRAKRWFRRAAGQGHFEAQLRMVDMCKVPRVALKWLRAAGEQGNLRAIERLVCSKRYGLGEEERAKWVSEARKQGSRLVARIFGKEGPGIGP